ncbi:MAG: S-layer homology domain-containing protein, partial [Acidimicrobiaceae bacterium]|nr:S-layer homology domain-containing protein [Acidimicrobiaceae bacterium]
AGITQGCSQDPLRYCPDSPVTRAQMATFLVRALKLEDASPAGFEDVAADNIHSANIDKILAAGITQGCSQNPLRYCPDSPVTRAQMATFLARALDL